MAHRVMLVSAIFCGVVSLLLILNFWNMKQAEPLESKTIEVLVERLKQEPNNEELKKEIRQFDLLARKAYFTSKWQVRTGTWLLLFGGILLAASMKIYTDLRSRIEEPEDINEELLRSRANAQYWLFLSGGLILGLALVAAFLTKDYLSMYSQQEQLAEQLVSAPAEDGPEVIEVFGENEEVAGDEGSGETGDEAEPDAGPAAETPAEEVEEAPAEEASVPVATVKSAAFNPEDFKKNQNTFRGYMGLGVSYAKNVPTDWNGASGKNIKWKVNLSKPGYNSPVIWGDQLYVSGGDMESRMVFCFNRNTGKLLWEKTVDEIPGSPASAPKTTEDTGLAAPTMAADATGCYAMFATGDLIAFDHGGKRLWAKNLGVPKNHYGHSSSLMVWDNRLVVQFDDATGGRLKSFNTANGVPHWEVERPVGMSWASPALINFGAKVQVVTSSDPFVMGNDLGSGEELWKYQVMMGEVGPSVAYEDGLVYATQEYATTVALAPEAGKEIVWEDDEYMSEVGSPVAYKGLLFMATSFGVVICYDGKTGEKVWEMEFDDEIWSSPMGVDGKVYIMDKGGVCHIIKADRSSTVLASPELGDAGFAAPVFADGMLYLRGGTKTLYCIQ